MIPGNRDLSAGESGEQPEAVRDTLIIVGVITAQDQDILVVAGLDRVRCESLRRRTSAGLVVVQVACEEYPHGVRYIVGLRVGTLSTEHTNSKGGLVRANSIIFAAVILTLSVLASESRALEQGAQQATIKPEGVTIELDPTRPVHSQAELPASELAPVEKCTNSPTPALDPIRRVLLVDGGFPNDDMDALARKTIAYWQETAPDDVDAEKIVLVVYDIDSGHVGVGVGDKWRPEGGVINMATFWTWVNWRFPEEERDVDEYVCAMLDGLALNVVRTHFRHTLTPKDMPDGQAKLIRRVQNAKWKLDGTVESLAGLVEKDAPALTELERTAGEAQILYFIAECLAFAGDQDAADMRLERANQLADEARDFIQEYRNAIETIEKLESLMQDTHDNLDEAGQMPFFDKPELWRQIRECDSEHHRLVEFSKTGPALEELDERTHQTRSCILDAASATAEAIDTHESIIYGGPLLFLLVVLPLAGASFVVLRSGASKRRLPLMDAITEWEERRPLLEARLEGIRSALGAGDTTSDISADGLPLDADQIHDIAVAFALFDELDRRFDEAAELRARAGTFGALKLMAAHDLVVECDIELTPEAIDESSPIHVEIEPPPAFAMPGAVTELEELSERAAQHAHHLKAS